MRIFVCFAAEQRGQAEEIALALRGRGHAVFFSKDTLPIAEEFHDRIQKAVDAADLLIYLISPQAVEKGNYTLTELSYARKKWPNPSGHVLPVMIVPTDMDKVPAYLRSVGILEPEGNVAAETAAHVDGLVRRGASRQLLLFTAGGVVSGFLSYLAIRYLGNYAKLGIISHDGVSVVAGVVFGGLLAFCNYATGFRDRVGLACIVIFTMLSWVVAVESTASVHGKLEKYQRTVYVDQQSEEAETQNDNSGPKTRAESLPYVLGLSGIVGGFVGGGGTMVGIAIVNRRFRRLQELLLILMVAAALGALLETMRINGENLGYFILFTCWQATMSGLIARSLIASNPEAESFDFRSIWQH